MPLYNTLAYFGSGYLISELCPACLTGISGCFFSLVFLFACFSFFCSLWLAFQVLPGPCNLHRPGGIPRIALGKGGKKKGKKKKKKLLCPLCHTHTPYSVLSSFPRATSSRVYTQWHMAQSLKPSLWPLVTGIYPIPSAGSVYDDLVLFLHAFTPLITFGFNL